MSRVLIPGDGAWYHELKAVAYYGESDLERVIRDHVRSLFPDFYVFPYKRDVARRDASETKRPDLAMVRRDFSAWGVIEIELSEKNLTHVLEQTSCFKAGEYNTPETAKYIRGQLRAHCKKMASLGRLQDLITHKLPTVLVIADAHVDAWERPLKQAGVDLCIFQIFKNTRGHYIYRALGDYPIIPAREAHCRRHPTLSNTLEIIGHFEFKRLGKSRQVDVVFDARLTRWTFIEDGGKSYLQFLGRINPLSPNATYSLFADRRNKYYFGNI